MDIKFLGLLPYLYFSEPIVVGSVKFTPIFLYGTDYWPTSADDSQHLKRVLGLFVDGTGQPILAATYFIIETVRGKEEEFFV
jgi:hypothetical protein